MTRVAAIDCGTNSIRLLVADVDPRASVLVDVERRMEVVRLGEGVDRTGRLAPEALDRTFAACDRYARVIDDLGAESVRFVATSATRDAVNRDEFVAGVRTRVGVEPEVVSGAEEAALSFAGATRDLDRDRFAPPYLVVDIGGGSTEFVLGDVTLTASVSVDMGCVRLMERHLRSDPPTPAEVAAATVDVRTAIELAARSVRLREAGTLVGVAGTVTTVVAMALELPRYDPVAIHLARVPAGGVADAADRLLAATRTDRAALPFMHPGRVDVIGAGALILREIVEHTRVDAIVVSEHDILDGIAFTAAEWLGPE